LLTQVIDWELEIRKRYAQPLFSESNEFPDIDTIQSRMVPICYEMGVGGGASNNSAEYLNLATETYMKKILEELLGTAWSNGDSYIKTEAYKRRLGKEESMWLRGEDGVVRNAAGLLPAEVEASEGRKAFNMGDFRLSLKTADGHSQQNPLTAARVIEGWTGTLSDWYDGDDDQNEDSSDAVKANGITSAIPLANGHVNGVADEMDLDGTPDDWGWAGGGASDRQALGSLLDDCLGV
jgi:transcriptional coactivator HFI1/ADA1